LDEEEKTPGQQKFEQTLKEVTERKRAYQAAFGVAPAGDAVLADLMLFCRGRISCLVPGDSDKTYALLGRNEVWHRIRDYLDLTPEEIVEKRYIRPAKGAYGHEPSPENSDD
jgi:hypothetical protein